MQFCGKILIQKLTYSAKLLQNSRPCWGKYGLTTGVAKTLRLGQKGSVTDREWRHVDVMLVN